MSMKSGWILILCGICALLLCACGGGGGDSSTTDGDSIVGDGDSDDATSCTDGAAFHEGDNETSIWQLTDLSPLSWLQSYGTPTVYIKLSKDRLLFWLAVEGQPVCFWHKLTAGENGRWLVASDPEGCWYTVEKQGDIGLNMTNRNQHDDVPDAWSFMFYKATNIPDFDPTLCAEACECTSFLPNNNETTQK